MEALPSKQGGRAYQVTMVEVNVIRPLLPSAQSPGGTPPLIIQDRARVMVLPHLETRHAALRTHWETTYRWVTVLRWKIQIWLQIIFDVVRPRPLILGPPWHSAWLGTHLLWRGRGSELLIPSRTPAHSRPRWRPSSSAWQWCPAKGPWEVTLHAQKILVVELLFNVWGERENGQVALKMCIVRATAAGKPQNAERFSLMDQNTQQTGFKTLKLRSVIYMGQLVD